MIKVKEKKILKFSNSYLAKFIFCLCLSWLFALCSQIIITIPFNVVPISLMPLPCYLFALTIGWPAVYACFMFILQGALGAPFFSGFQGGFLKLFGPTGGYILGYLFLMIFLALVKNYKKNFFYINFLKLLIANIILYSFGLFQLSWFVSSEKLLFLGFIPFIFGMLIKVFIASIFIFLNNKYF